MSILSNDIINPLIMNKGVGQFYNPFCYNHKIKSCDENQRNREWYGLLSTQTTTGNNLIFIVMIINIYIALFIEVIHYWYHVLGWHIGLYLPKMQSLRYFYCTQISDENDIFHYAYSTPGDIYWDFLKK